MEKEDILRKIKQSKKYKTISEGVILAEIEKYIRKNPRYEIYKDKKILSEIKAELHKIHGSFQKISKRKREKYFEKLEKNSEDEEIVKKILLTNRSTKERLENYEKIYKKIFEITGKPETIVDLGCGLNPLSFIFMNLNKAKYSAYDIDEEDILLINKYFHLMKKRVSGKAEIMNLSSVNEKDIQKIPKADVCFMFKLVDVLDRRNHKQSEKVIKNLNSDYIVVSFSKRTLSGKKMNFPRRGWIEKMLERIGLKFEKIDFESEIFYVIAKNINF